MRQEPPGRGLTVALVAVVLLNPVAAAACPACFSAASEQSRLAYYWTAALMTLLPFTIVGAIGGWLYLRQRTPGRSPSEAPLPVLEVPQ